MTVARLVIAGQASGVGKTTTMLALTAALRARGLRVAAFKCGPDYLDPTYHARATGTTSHNLDGWMMGRDAVVETFARAAAGADVALIEGMMGIYDGASPDGEAGSAAEIAKWLAAPVVAVVDAGGMARTIAALGVGLRDFDRALRLAGLFANHVGSRGHLDLLKQACRAHVPVVGGLPRDAARAFPERHLGLRTADEEIVPDALVAAWGAAFAEWNDVDAFVALARSAPPLDLPAVAPPPPSARRCRIAVARDAAFHFYYEYNLAALRALGAELVPFSPIADAALPDVDGVLLGGGYPELHAARLAANESMRASMRDAARRGVVIYAECGGLMYLADAIHTVDGVSHPMLGLVAGTAVMADRLQAIGYVEVETQRTTPLGATGLRLRGHQFRYSTLDGARGDAYRVRTLYRAEPFAEGYGEDNVLGSYVHAHFASNPIAAENLVAACTRR
ncbi:MAG TPA: cobyrinate a,c-diamide synthase [Polyangia bacterium]|jgi:cobyrinic acid a,c-diamide synthase